VAVVAAPRRRLFLGFDKDRAVVPVFLLLAARLLVDL
jgi:hypothetical protein